MKKGKILISTWMSLFAMLLTCEVVSAQEPYEKIAVRQEWEMLKLTNEQRLEKGLEPFSMFSSIQKGCDVRGEEIKDNFSHIRPDGRMWYTALQDNKVHYNYAAENIAAGQSSPAMVVSSWMNSAGHRANILNSELSHMGAGYETGGDYGRNWVQLFVGGCAVESVAVNETNSSSYPVGTTIDDMNRYLIVRCSNHELSYVPVSSKMCVGYDSSKSGEQTVTVKYQGEKISMTVITGQTDVSESSESSDTVKKPAKVKNLKVTKKTKKTVSLKWSKRSGDGYEVWRATSKNGTYKKIKTLTASKRTAYKASGLKSGKKYYFKVRAYKKADGKKIYGRFSKAVVVKTK